MLVTQKNWLLKKSLTFNPEGTQDNSQKTLWKFKQS